MNYFAHLVLSQPTVESAVGNLLGDFAKGVKLEQLGFAVRSGLDNHRAVDRFTDTYEHIRSLKHLFSAKRRRFAGIALDVYFDHLLMQHWTRFDLRPLDQVIGEFYQRLTLGRALMPNAQMLKTTQSMVDYDWFGSYRDIDSIAHALDRIALRLRFENQFDNAIEDILANQSEINDVFLVFFPELLTHVQNLSLETKTITLVDRQVNSITQDRDLRQGLKRT